MVAESTIHVLASSGDITISWNPAVAAEIAEARRAVEDLRTQGYAFFRVDGSPAPESIDAGIAVLSCRRIEAAEVVEPRRRGRPRKQPATETATATETSAPAPEPTRTVATRPLRGG